MTVKSVKRLLCEMIFKASGTEPNYVYDSLQIRQHFRLRQQNIFSRVKDIKNFILARLRNHNATDDDNVNFRSF